MGQASESSLASAVFPATPGQRHLWALEHGHGDALSRNIAVRWELRGRFADGSVEAAFQTVYDRHEILRTGLAMREGVLEQRVSAGVRFRLVSIDLRGVPEADREARVRAIAVEQAAAPFDLAVPGQLRASLVRLAPDRAALLIATHYGVFDGFSIRVLGREIGTLIAAAEAGVPPALPELALQYGDYAAWREACLASGALDDSRAWWHEKLADTPYFEVPTDHPRRPGHTRTGATLKIPLPAPFGADLERAAKGAGASAFALGAAVMAAALHAETGLARVGMTTCVAGREELEFENLIGTFVNPVVLGFDCGGATFADLIRAARVTVTEALARGDYPFDLLAAELDQPADPGRTPFVSPFFSLQTVFVEEADYGPLRIVSVPSHTPYVTHDLALQVIGRASGWDMLIDYDAALFDETRVRRFAATVEAGFAAAFADPETLVGSLVQAVPATAPAPGAPSVPTNPADPRPATPLPSASPHPVQGQPTLAMISDIWRKVIGRPPHGPATSFFDLGGNSLEALRMLARVESALGARISVSEFFDDPTLGGFARKVDASLGVRSPDHESALWERIDLLVARAPAAGAVPLVVSLNQPFLYRGIAGLLGTGADFVNLHIRTAERLDGADARVLEEVIAEAAAGISAIAADRPLVLIGHCVDGTLALLVARRLAQAGAPPALVTMIDCWAPDADAGETPLRRRLRRNAARVRRWTINLRQRAAGKIGWTEFLARSRLTRPVLERLGRVERPTDTEREEWAINRRLVQLVRAMAHEPYAGEVVLFSTGGQRRDARARLFGWAGRLPADTPIFDVPGWHEYALKGPGRGRIAEVLATRLDRIRRPVRGTAGES